MRVRAPPTEYKTALRAKIHLKIHPEPPLETKIQKNTKNIHKSGVLVSFSYFFCILVSGEDSGCILGCILDFRGVLYSVGGAGTRK